MFPSALWTVKRPVINCVVCFPSPLIISIPRSTDEGLSCQLLFCVALFQQINFPPINLHEHFFLYFEKKNHDLHRFFFWSTPLELQHRLIRLLRTVFNLQTMALTSRISFFSNELDFFRFTFTTICCTTSIDVFMNLHACFHWWRSNKINSPLVEILWPSTEVSATENTRKRYQQHFHKDLGQRPSIYSALGNWYLIKT